MVRQVVDISINMVDIIVILSVLKRHEYHDKKK